MSAGKGLKQRWGSLGSRGTDLHKVDTFSVLESCVQLNDVVVLQLCLQLYLSCHLPASKILILSLMLTSEGLPTSTVNSNCSRAGHLLCTTCR